MDCAAEESLIRGKLSPMAGITRLDFNLIQKVLTVTHSLDTHAPVEAALKSLGFVAIPTQSDTNSQAPGSSRNTIGEWVPLITAGVFALGSELVELSGILAPWLPAGLAVVSVLIGGWATYRKGWIALINRNLNINALMSIAVTGAFALGQWPEAAMVMVLFAVAEKIESLSLNRARKSIQGLMEMSPDLATTRRADGSWSVVEANSVVVGTVARVRPGERISHDGEITTGNTSIDQSAITGESMPVEKNPADNVFAGTVNLHGEFEFRVTSEAKTSTLSRIIHLVEEAQASRSSTQRFVDRFAEIYTPLVFGIALLVAIIPPLMLGGLWFEWVYKALVLLVIACPCALVISTPVSIVSTLTRAAQLGIIVKGGVFLEQARHLDWLAFDKTGTITHGKPVQTDFIVLGQSGFQIERVAYSLAHRSDHPVSRAIAAFRLEEQLSVLDIGNFRALVGRGVQGVIDNQIWYLGNHRLVEELGICNASLEAHLQELERQGKTAVVLATDTNPVAVFGVADTIRESSRSAIRELHELGVKTLMLSGDNLQTAAVISRQVNIDDVRGEQLPEDKSRAIKELSSKNALVGMVGDGINDSPALAAAGIGIAMGGIGTATAIETADVVLMDDDLGKVPQLIRLSKKMVQILYQNIGIALGLKALFFVLTLMGYGTMWMAVFADMGASLIVVFNGLRLLRTTP